jgi:choline dehydrogenase
VNWLYATEPDTTLNGRSVVWWGGKMLGGGSAINGMVYIRGTPYDYDAWAAAGCTGRSPWRAGG